MTDVEIDHFVSARTIEEMRHASQPLLQTSAAARAAKSPAFEAAFQAWCDRLTVDGASTLPLLAGLWRLSSLSSMARCRSRLQRALRASLGPPSAPLSALMDPKDRKAVAEALMHVEADWVAPFVAEAIVRDGDPKSDARDVLSRVLLRRTGEVGAAFLELARTMASVVIEQTDVATGRARRIAWILRSMRPALYGDEEAFAEGGSGESFAEFVFAGLRSSPNDRSAALDAAREVLLCLNAVVRLHGVSLATSSTTYSVLHAIRRRLGWHDWPEELSEACGVVGVRIEEALFTLARQGIADRELRNAYIGLFGAPVAATRLKRAMTRLSGIDDDMRYWIENGSSRIRLETSSAIEASAISAIDEDLAKALIELAELRMLGTDDVEEGSFRRLARSVDDAARRRGLSLRGERGLVVTYMPGEHLLDRADVGAREVRLLRPVVDRVIEGRRMGVVLKAEVEPASGER